MKTNQDNIQEVRDGLALIESMAKKNAPKLGGIAQGPWATVLSTARQSIEALELTFDEWCAEVKAVAKRQGVGYLFPEDISFLKEYYDEGETPQEHVLEQINAGL